MNHKISHLGLPQSRGGAKQFSSRWLWCFLMALTLMCSFPCVGAVDWPTLGFTQYVATVYNQPAVICNAGDGSQRLFIVEQIGRVRLIQSNNVIAQPFLNISNRVQTAGPEQGLLGMAFPPNFSSKNYFYVDYTRKSDGAVVISRFQVTNNRNIADTNSEQIIEVIPHPNAIHNGGQLAFGPDGYLYIGVGDGGPEGDTQIHAQNTHTNLGKILRIDVESGVSPYAVPTNNPFVGNPNYLPEIWAYGLRNPWRFSFDRGTGDLYIGDVGQSRYEEIDFQTAGSSGGQNYGWRIMEGPTNYNVPSGFTNFAGLTLPVAWYDHYWLPTDLSGAVIGGSVYRGPDEPRFNGVYFYGDFEAGWIWGLKRDGTNWQTLPLLTPAYPNPHYYISTFGEDELGRIYLADYYAGLIYRMVDTRQVWAPGFSPTNGIVNSNTVLVACITTNAVIHYTSNGIDPTPADPVVPISGAIPITTGRTNKVRAFRADLTPSSVVSAIFTNKVGTPVFSPPAGPVPSNALINITTVTPGAVIYFTTNGTPPTTSSSVYVSPITIGQPMTIQAFAVANGYSNSLVSSGTFSMAAAATPVFTPSSPVNYGTSVSINCSTPGSSIFYTLDGTTPTVNSTPYTIPITITCDTNIQAFATATNYLNSPVQNVAYTLVKTAQPVFTPSPTILTNGTMIFISSTTSNALILYTTDGSDPNTNPAAFTYSSPLTFTNPIVLSARAYATHFDTSDEQSKFLALSDMESYVVTTYAGSPTRGFSNGLAAMATFYNPGGLALDGSNNLFVADNHNEVIREISAAGQVTTFAGSGIRGYLDGTATNAQFSDPVGCCIDSLGNFYFTDNCQKIRKLDTNGIITTFATAPGSCSIVYVTVDTAGNVYAGIAGVLVKYPPGGPLVTWNANGSGSYVAPRVSPANNVYAAQGPVIWHFDTNGTPDLFAGTVLGYTDGSRLLAQFQNPLDIAFDTAGNMFVADKYSVRRISTNGRVTTVAGTLSSGYRNGRSSTAQFNGVDAICVDTNGNIYVADSGNNCIRKISPDTAGIGIPDDWQMQHFGHVGIDPNDDPDHDGVSNYGEFWSGTDPLDPNSVLIIDRSSQITSGHIQIRLQTVAGKTYLIQYSSDLASWNNLGNPIQGDGTIVTIIDPAVVSANTQRYYRVSLTF